MSSALIPYVLSSLLFFPYLPFSLKAEYVFVLLAILPYLFLRNFKFNKEILILSFCLISTLPFVLLTSFHSFETGLFASPLTMFARLALPGAMLISFSFALCSAENVFEHTIRAITISGSILAAVAIASLIFPNFSTLLWPWIINEESSVWSQSMNLGRVPGLFNQPLEAGLFYSIALFASVIGFKLRSKIVISDYVFLILIFIGGIITLSKVFLVLGVVLSILLASSLRLLTFRFYPIVAIGVLIIFIFVESYAPVYTQSLIELYEHGGLLFSITAGRLGSISENTGLYQRLFSDSNWILGFGLGSYLPLDSGYLEYFYQGGIFSLLCFLCFIFILLIISYTKRTSTEGKLILFLSILLIFASIGGPVITAGRSNIAFIILLAAALSKNNICFQKNEKVV